MKIYAIVEEVGTCPSDWEYTVIETHTSEAVADALAKAFNDSQPPRSGVARYVYEVEHITDAG